MEKFFNPKSVAVIGASGNRAKVGHSLVANLLQSGNRAVYPVTLNEKEILGIPSYASILDVPGEVDLAIIAVRAEITPQILSDCGKKRIPNAIIISSGFKETGSVGKELEEEITKIARENGIKLLGPNCLGIIDVKNNFNASFAAQRPLPGRIALLSQSGALGTAMLDWAMEEGVGFSKFISLGNEAQLSEIEFLEYLENDADTEAILIYLERINDGPNFIKLLRSITPKKPVIILKAGTSEYGVSAIMSHTGSLAPQAEVFAAACKQAGAMIDSSVRKFFNSAKIISLGASTTNPIQRLAVVTNGGGPSVIVADEVGISGSLSLVEFGEEVKSKLREVLPPMAAVGNPVDIIGDALAERYEKVLDILSQIKEVEGIIVMLTPQLVTEAQKTAALLSKYKEKEVKFFPVFIGGPFVAESKKVLINSGFVNFNFSKDLIGGLDDLARGAPKKPPFKTIGFKKEAESVSQMPFTRVSELLNGYGIKVSGKMAASVEEMEGFINGCAGPYALKVMSPSIVHKTEAGALKLNISNLDEARAFWGELESKFPEREGILVQQMLSFSAPGNSGKELIIGMKRDGTFGATILFGLGGIFTEAIKDTSMRVAPVLKDEAMKMMKEIKGIKILEGMRGEKPVNFDLLAEIIQNLSRLATEHPEIKEIDLNPVFATESSATIIDARVMT